MKFSKHGLLNEHTTLRNHLVFAFLWLLQVSQEGALAFLLKLSPKTFNLFWITISQWTSEAISSASVTCF